MPYVSATYSRIADTIRSAFVMSQRRRHEVIEMLILLPLSAYGSRAITGCNVVCGRSGNESVPKIVINDTIFFLNCNQHSGNFKP